MIINKLTSLISPSLLRYVVVGVVSLAVDYLIFMSLYYGLHTGTAVAAPSGLILGLIVNFMLNKLWSFGNRSAEARQVARQAIYYAGLVVINSIFTYFFIEFMKKNDILEPKFSKLLATAIITLWNYVLYQKVIFKSED